ncbi:hypothetical protein [Reyranella sp. CPCC 100927]|nr:hypothetical protein [Reyranella sp. CPCC 100927]
MPVEVHVQWVPKSWSVWSLPVRGVAPGSWWFYLGRLQIVTSRKA